MALLPQLTNHSDAGFITEGQDKKHNTSNNLDALIDNAMNRPSDLAVGAGGTFTLNTPQTDLDLYLASGLIRVTGSPAAPTNITVPDGNKRIAFFNDSTKTTTIDTVTGAATPVSIAPGVVKSLHIRGIEIIIVADDASQTGALLADGTVSVTGNFDWDDFELKRALLKDYAEKMTAPASSGTIDLDLELGNVFDVTLDQNTTFTFSNPPISGRAGSFTLYMRQDDTGGWLNTFPPSVQWEGGSKPTFSLTANQYDVVSFLTIDGGTIWSAFLGGLNFA